MEKNLDVYKTGTGYEILSPSNSSIPWEPIARLELMEERDDRSFGRIGLYGVTWVREHCDDIFDLNLRAWIRPNQEKLKNVGDYTTFGWFRVTAVEHTAHHSGMKYREALKAGYIDSETALQRGYVSRLSDPDEAEVHVAGGTRHGQLYVLRNNPRSNRYCIRQYLRKRLPGE